MGGVATMRLGTSSSGPLAIFGGNLLAWWDASNTASFTLAGSNVTSWADVSGHGLTADQSTAGQKPLYSATALGGKPGVTFDGVDDALQMSSVASFPTGTNACTLIAIAKLDSVGSYPQLFGYGKASSLKYRGLAGVAGNGKVGVTWYADDQETTTLWNAQRLAICQFSGSTCDVSIDGGANTTITSVGAPSVDASGNSGVVGQNPAGAGSGNYIVQELLVVSGTVTAAQIAAMQAYRAAKW